MRVDTLTRINITKFKKQAADLSNEDTKPIQLPPDSAWLTDDDPTPTVRIRPNFKAGR